MHIIFESVLMLFTKNYQNQSVLVEIQLAKVGTFFETQCTAMLVISPTAFSFVTYLKTHGWMGGWVGGWWMDGCIDPDIS